MICFDTNVIIYFGNGTLQEDLISDEPLCLASISAVESLGYPDILAGEELRISELLGTMLAMPLSQNVIETAIQLRQLKRMGLADAIVAATALSQDCVLWTANTKVFKHIDGLTLFNPLADGSTT